jgi:phosphoglycerate dehydrogenase-like enzyme
MLARILASTIVLCGWLGSACADPPRYSDTDSDIAALVARLGLESSPVASRDWARWRRPQRIVVRVDSSERLEWLRAAAPGVALVPARDDAQAAAAVPGADAMIGFCDPENVDAGTELRWIQVFWAGVEDCVAIPALRERGIHLTNMQRVAGPVMAEHVFALLLGLTRGLGTWVDAQRAGEWKPTAVSWDGLVTLQGKTLLVAGLGGIGSEVARLAHAFGMTVLATRASGRMGPDYVSYVGLPAELEKLAARADVVVNTVPLTAETQNMFAERFFAALKPGAYFINVGRGGSVDTQALVAALDSDRLAGAGLDVTEPEPLPAGHPLWSHRNVIITPHVSARTDAGREDRWLIVRENLRRYVNGEPLLSVVDVEKGY